MNLSDNLSLVLKKKLDLILEVRKIPEVGSQDVLVGVESVGICGSDVHYWQRGYIGQFILKSPMVLGHETSGRVVSIGSKVKHLSPGDRVALEVGVPCRLCQFCKIGSYNVCPDIKFCATPPIDGTLCRYFAHPADMCFKLPDHVTYEEGAMLEPLSVAVSACTKSRVTFGQTIFVSGAGPIGLLTLLTCKAAGVDKVCISDIDAGRLKFAAKLGADVTYLTNPTMMAQENATNVAKSLGRQADVSIECSGAENALQTCIFVTKPGGIVQAVGFGNDLVNVPMSDIISRDIRLQGGFRYANCYPTALALVSSGKVDVKALITHHFPLEQASEAFQTAHDPKSGSVKVMIKCSK
uniref:Sorbitol dehydrogenase n=1 Tax=Romanomermis culicivorax TaxID=13658 RepID=A0A915I7B7_ROMCU